MLRSFVVQLLLVALGVIFAGTVIAVVTLWPSDRTVEAPPQLRVPKTERAEVTGVRLVPCAGGTRSDCQRVEAKLETGPDEGTEAVFTFQGREVDFELGDRIRVYKTPLPENATIGGVRVDPYGFSDFERRSPLVWLALVFVALVVATARWRGIRALVGLVGSLLVVVGFIVPAILDGRSPAGVAIAGSLAVMFVTIPLTHGVGPKTIAACLGTASALLLTLALANAFTKASHLSGVSSEEAAFLRATTGTVSLQGLLLAGMVIGALGVLDDLTVTQASTVLALRSANPRLGFRDLFGRALSVGHDHIAATVNTLVLAYVGAALPVLLVFSLASMPFGDAVNSEAVAEEIVATLVGSIGLIAAVPITTGLAALLATRVPQHQLGDAHVH